MEGGKSMVQLEISLSSQWERTHKDLSNSSLASHSHSQQEQQSWGKLPSQNYDESSSLAVLIFQYLDPN